VTDPDHALAICRDIGFAEGAWIYDVRAGCCQITTLTASVVILVCENGQPLALDGADVLLDSYRDDSIRLEEDEP
jgi:hypothetical protein